VPVRDDLAWRRRLELDPPRPQTAYRGQAIAPGQIPLDAAGAIGQRRQQQRPMGERFVAGNVAFAAQRAARGKRQRVIHPDFSSCTSASARAPAAKAAGYGYIATFGDAPAFVG